MLLAIVLIATYPLLALTTPTELRAARDRQDRPALEKMIAELAAAAGKNAKNSDANYQLALASHYLAEICLELRLKNEARSAAESGIRAAEKAVAAKPDFAEYHRILGTLCGQVIPANVLAGLKYGRCALDSVNKAIQLDPKSSDGYVSRGVGNYYLPPSFGGGIELAIRDFQKALELNPKSADAQLWLGIALRKKK
ncbi:MAG TPA: tetratricopeptide repeat protein, partial [Bryobacteraceae bacterium]|nr:tetratricopeptide repeat protein [Bryobacteraceae bacterium]